MSVRIRMDWIHLTEDYMDNMGQFAPNRGVDPELIHFDANVYWFSFKGQWGFERQIREVLPPPEVRYLAC